MAAPPVSLPRRSVLAAGVVAAVAAAVGRPDASARAIFQRGMSGGGLAQVEGEGPPQLANFGLFASAMQLPDGNTLVLGQIQWIEVGSDFRLQSTQVLSCVPTQDRPDGAEVRGRMSANGEGDYPFVIRAMDSGLPGSGLDRVEIGVNTDAARQGADPPSDDEFAYEVAAAVVAGDLQWIVADIDLGS